MKLLKSTTEKNGKTYVNYWLVVNNVKVAVKPAFVEDYKKLSLIVALTNETK